MYNDEYPLDGSVTPDNGDGDKHNPIDLDALQPQTTTKPVDLDTLPSVPSTSRKRTQKAVVSPQVQTPEPAPLSMDDLLSMRDKVNQAYLTGKPVDKSIQKTANDLEAFRENNRQRIMSGDQYKNWVATNGEPQEGLVGQSRTTSNVFQNAPVNTGTVTADQSGTLHNQFLVNLDTRAGQKGVQLQSGVVKDYSKALGATEDESDSVVEAAKKVLGENQLWVRYGGKNTDGTQAPNTPVNDVDEPILSGDYLPSDKGNFALYEDNKLTVGKLTNMVKLYKQLHPNEAVNTDTIKSWYDANEKQGETQQAKLDEWKKSSEADTWYQPAVDVMHKLFDVSAGEDNSYNSIRKIESFLDPTSKNLLEQQVKPSSAGADNPNVPQLTKLSETLNGLSRMQTNIQVQQQFEYMAEKPASALIASALVNPSVYLGLTKAGIDVGKYVPDSRRLLDTGASLVPFFLNMPLGIATNMATANNQMADIPVKEKNDALIKQGVILASLPILGKAGSLLPKYGSTIGTAAQVGLFGGDIAYGAFEHPEEYQTNGQWDVAKITSKLAVDAGMLASMGFHPIKDIAYEHDPVPDKALNLVLVNGETDKPAMLVRNPNNGQYYWRIISDEQFGKLKDDNEKNNRPMIYQKVNSDIWDLQTKQNGSPTLKENWQLLTGQKDASAGTQFRSDALDNTSLNQHPLSTKAGVVMDDNRNPVQAKSNKFLEDALMTRPAGLPVEDRILPALRILSEFKDNLNINTAKIAGDEDTVNTLKLLNDRGLIDIDQTTGQIKPVDAYTKQVLDRYTNVSEDFKKRLDTNREKYGEGPEFDLKQSYLDNKTEYSAKKSKKEVNIQPEKDISGDNYSITQLSNMSGPKKDALARGVLRGEATFDEVTGAVRGNDFKVEQPEVPVESKPTTIPKTGGFKPIKADDIKESDYSFRGLKTGEDLGNKSGFILRDTVSGRLLSVVRGKHDLYSDTGKVKIISGRTSHSIAEEINSGKYDIGDLKSEKVSAPPQAQKAILDRVTGVGLSDDQHNENEKNFGTGELQVTPTLKIDSSAPEWGRNQPSHFEQDPKNKDVVIVNNRMHQLLASLAGVDGLDMAGFTHTGDFWGKKINKATEHLKGVYPDEAKAFQKLGESIKGLPSVAFSRLMPEGSSYDEFNTSVRHEKTHSILMTNAQSNILPREVYASVLNTDAAKLLRSTGLYEGRHTEDLTDSSFAHEVLAYGTEDAESLKRDDIKIDTPEKLEAFYQTYKNLLQNIATHYGADAERAITELAHPDTVKAKNILDSNENKAFTQGLSDTSDEGGTSPSGDVLRQTWSGSGPKTITAKRLTPTGEFDSYTNYPASETSKRTGGQRTFNFFVQKEDGTYVLEGAFKNNKTLKVFGFNGNLNLLDIGVDPKASADYNNLEFKDFQKKYEDQGYHGFFSSRSDLPDEIKYRMAVFDNDITRAVLTGDQKALTMKAKDLVRSAVLSSALFKNVIAPFASTIAEPFRFTRDMKSTNQQAFKDKTGKIFLDYGTTDTYDNPIWDKGADFNFVESKSIPNQFYVNPRGKEFLTKLIQAGSKNKQDLVGDELPFGDEMSNRIKIVLNPDQISKDLKTLKGVPRDEMQEFSDLAKTITPTEEGNLRKLVNKIESNSKNNVDSISWVGVDKEAKYPESLLSFSRHEDSHNALNEIIKGDTGFDKKAEDVFNTPEGRIVSKNLEKFGYDGSDGDKLFEVLAYSDKLSFDGWLKNFPNDGEAYLKTYKNALNLIKKNYGDDALEKMKSYSDEDFQDLANKQIEDSPLFMKAKERINEDKGIADWVTDKPLVTHEGNPIFYHGREILRNLTDADTYQNGFAKLESKNYPFVSFSSDETVPDEFLAKPDRWGGNKPVVYPVILKGKVFDYENPAHREELQTWAKQKLDESGFKPSEIAWNNPTEAEKASDTNANLVAVTSDGYKLRKFDEGRYQLVKPDGETSLIFEYSPESAKKVAEVKINGAKALEAENKTGIPVGSIISDKLNTDRYGIRIGTYDPLESKAALQFYRENGYDVFTTHEFDAKNFHVFDARNVRSPFAQFKDHESDDLLAMKSKASPAGFYSPTEEALLQADDKNRLPKIASGKDWMNKVKGLIYDDNGVQRGIKNDELEWTGLDQFLEGKDRVSKEDVLNYVKNNKVVVKRVQFGGKIPEDIPDMVEAKQRLANAQQELDTVKTEKDAALKEINNNLVWTEEAYHKFWNSDLGKKYEELVKQVHKAQEDIRFLNSQKPSTAKWSGWTSGGEKKNDVELALQMPSLVKGGQTDFNESTLPDGYEVVTQENAQTAGGVHNLYKVVSEDNTYYKHATTKEEAIKNFWETFKARQTPIYESPHYFPDNTLVHIRGNERTLVSGEDAFHIEEIQSDFHQTGKRLGYLTGNELLYGPQGDIDENVNWNEDSQPVPDAPFKDTGWLELAFKSAVRYAVENGFKKVTWSTGDQQIERNSTDMRRMVSKIDYDVEHPLTNQEKEEFEKAKTYSAELQQKRDSVGLSDTEKSAAELLNKQFASLKYMDPIAKSRAIITVHPKDGSSTKSYRIPLEGTTYTSGRDVSLDSLLGKKMADEVRNNPEGKGTFEGEGLSIGGALHKFVYDNAIPTFAKKFFKKYGVEIKNTDQIDTDNGEFRKGETVGPLFNSKQDANKYIKSNDLIPEGLIVDSDRNGARIYKKTSGPQPENVWSMTIPDSLTKSTEEGLPLFMKRKQKAQEDYVDRLIDTPEVRQDRLMKKFYNTSPQDHTVEGVSNIVKQGFFSNISAAKEGMSEEEATTANGNLKKDLEEFGLKVMPSKGVYNGSPEDSFMVYYPYADTAKVIQYFGQKYGQESVLHGAGGKYWLEMMDGSRVETKDIQVDKDGRIYHGTTDENLRSITSSGLRKGTFVSPDYDTANSFAQDRANWNGNKPVVFKVDGKTNKISSDRSGRLESTLTDIVPFKNLQKIEKRADGTYIKTSDGEIKYNVDFNSGQEVPAPIGYSLKPMEVKLATRQAIKDTAVLTPQDIQNALDGVVMNPDGLVSNVLVDAQGKMIDDNAVTDASGKVVGTAQVDNEGNEYFMLGKKKITLIDGVGTSGKEVTYKSDTQATRQTTEKFFKGTSKRDVIASTGFFQEVSKLYDLPKPDKYADKEDIDAYKAARATILNKHVQSLLDQYNLADPDSIGKAWYGEAASEFADRVGKTIPDVNRDAVKLWLWLTTAVTSPNARVEQNAGYAMNTLAAISRFYKHGELFIPKFQYDNAGNLILKNDGQPTKLGLGTPAMEKLEMLSKGYVLANTLEGFSLFDEGGEPVTSKGIVDKPVNTAEKYIFSPTAKAMMEKHGALQGVLNFLLSPAVEGKKFNKAADLLGDKVGSFFSNLAGLSQTPTIDTWMNRYFLALTGDALKVTRDKAGSISKIQDFTSNFDTREGDFFRGVIQKATEDFNNRTDSKLSPADVQAIIWTQVKSMYNSLVDRQAANIDFADAYAQMKARVDAGTSSELPSAPSNPDLVKDAENKAPLVKQLTDSDWGSSQGSRYFIDQDDSGAFFMKAKDGKEKKDYDIDVSDPKLAAGDFNAWIDVANRLITGGHLEEKEIDQIKKLSDAKDVKGLTSYVLSLNKTGVFDLFVQAIRANPLTGLKNVSKNVSSSELYQLTDEIARIPAFVLNTVGTELWNKIRGTESPNTIYRPSVISQLKAMVKGISYGIPDGVRFMKEGGDISSFESGSIFREKTTGIAVLKPLEIYTKYAFRFHEAAHKPFKAQAYFRALDGLTTLKQKEMDKGTSYQDARDNLNIADYDAAFNTALQFTFQDSNALANGIYTWRNKQSPLVQSLIDLKAPYVKTPLNVEKAILNYSGLYPLIKTFIKGYGFDQWRDFRNSTVKLLDNPEDRAAIAWGVSRGAIGWSVAYMGYKLAKAGILMAFYDKNDRKDSAEMGIQGTHWGSITIGGRSYDITDIKPTSFYLLAGAAWANKDKEFEEAGQKLDDRVAQTEKSLELAKETGDTKKIQDAQMAYDEATKAANPAERGSAVSSAVTTILKNFALQVPVLGNAIQEVEKSDNPKDYLYNELLDTLGVTRWLPAIVGETAKTLDRKERVTEYKDKVKRGTDQLKAQIPTTSIGMKAGQALQNTGLPVLSQLGDALKGRQDMPVKYDMLGREIEAPVGYDPLKSTKVNTDRVTTDMAKYGVTIGDNTKGTAAEKNAAVGAKGQYLDPKLTTVVNSDDYNSANPETQKKMLQDTIRYFNPEFKKDKLKDDEESHNLGVLVKRDLFTNELKQTPQKYAQNMTITDEDMLKNAAKAGIKQINMPQVIQELQNKDRGLEGFIDSQFTHNLEVGKNLTLTEAQKNYQDFQNNPQLTLLKWYLQQKVYEERQPRLKARREELLGQGKSEKEINKIMAHDRIVTKTRNADNKVDSLPVVGYGARPASYQKAQDITGPENQMTFDPSMDEPMVKNDPALMDESGQTVKIPDSTAKRRFDGQFDDIMNQLQRLTNPTEGVSMKDSGINQHKLTKILNQLHSLPATLMDSWQKDAIEQLINGNKGSLKYFDRPKVPATIQT